MKPSVRLDHAFVKKVFALISPGIPAETDWEALRQLAASGADFNAGDEYVGGKSPLMWAAYFGRADLARFLLDAGAEVDAWDSDGKTALHHLCSERDQGKEYWPDREEQMLEDGATIEECDAERALYGYAPEDRDEAQMRAEAECFGVLVSARADVNHRAVDGTISLILAAWNGKFHLVEALIAQGADVNVRAENGLTALSGALDQRNPRCIELLRAAGAQGPS